MLYCFPSARLATRAAEDEHHGPAKPFFGGGFPSVVQRHGPVSECFTATSHVPRSQNVLVISQSLLVLRVRDQRKVHRATGLPDRLTVSHMLGVYLFRDQAGLKSMPSTLAKDYRPFAWGAPQLVGKWTPPFNRRVGSTLLCGAIAPTRKSATKSWRCDFSLRFSWFALTVCVLV